MHIQQPSLSPDCTPYEGRHLDPKSPPSIWSGACLVAVQTLGKYAGASVTLGPTALLPASILTTPALPSYWPACAWASPTTWASPATMARPVPVSFVTSWHCGLPSMCCGSPSHPCQVPLLETDATTPWQLRVKDAAMTCQI